jgi:hypothetical protein
VGLSLGGIMHYFNFDPYKFHNTAQDLWSEKWLQCRKSYENPPWQKSTPNTVTQYLNVAFNRIPKIKNPNQIRTIRVLLPLCGASPDLESVQAYIDKLLRTEIVDETKRRFSYKTKIIGVDISADAIEMFLDRMDRKKKGISEADFDVEEYMMDSEAHTSGRYGYDITMDRFSKLNIYRESNFYLINASIFHQSMPRLVLRADLIVDAQSLDVIETHKRKAYAMLMKAIMSKNGSMLIQVNRFNVNARLNSQRDSSPFSITKDDIWNLYRDMISDDETRIQLLHSENWLDCDPHKIQKLGFPEGYDGGWNDIYLIQGNDAVLRDSI